MRILMVTQVLNCGDGQGRVNLEIARHALSRGHEITVIAGQVDEQLLAAGAKWIQIRERLKRPALFRYWRFTQLANAHFRSLRSPVDITLGNGYVLTEPHDVSISHFVHHAWQSRESLVGVRRGLGARYQSLFTRCNVRLERRSYDAARMVVAVSERVRGELIDAGVAAGKIRVIYNGVDLEEFRPGLKDRDAVGLPAGVPLGLFVGDIRTSRKNLGTVLQALRAVPEIHLAVIGSADRSPFPAMAASLGIAGRVHFLGFRRDVAKIMRACDFFVFPTRHEPFGLAILEAMACGLPVITSRVAGAAEIMNNECGILLDDPEDAFALAAAMKRYTDPALQSRAGATARKRAEAHDWTRMAEQYLSIFEELRRPPASLELEKMAG